MTEHLLIGFFTFVGGSLITALISSAVSGRQKREDEQRKSTGTRIGSLEKRADYWEGFFDGVKYARSIQGRGDG